MNPNPAEKNLKHRTDVLEWESIDWSECEMNFRAPGAAGISMSPARALAHLLVASGIGAIGGVVAMNSIFPFMQSRSWIEVMVVAAVVAALIGSGYYRPLLRTVREQQDTNVAMCGAGSVLFLFVVVRFGGLQQVFGAGVFLLLCLALPWALFLADQMTGHMIHWLSADPRLDRNAMVVWRNAWCGRFMTEETEQLRGISPAIRSKLQQYWYGHLRVAVACMASVFVGMLGTFALGFDRTGVAISFLLTTSLAGLAISAYASTADATKLFPQSLGHWFEYQKDQRQPPWVLQSPAGPQIARAFSAYGAACAMSFALLLLGLSDASWGSRTLADVTQASPAEMLTVLVGATILTPLNLLFLCFIVSAPTTAVCHQAIEEVCDAQH